MGGLDRWPCTRARRYFFRALLHRAGTARSTRARECRCAAGDGTHYCRRMDTADRTTCQNLQSAERKHSKHSDCGRNDGSVCRHLCRPCPLWFPCARRCLRAARARCTRNPRSRLVAWTRARRPWPGRGLCYAPSGRLRSRGLLVALHLSCGRNCSGICACAGASGAGLRSRQLYSALRGRHPARVSQASTHWRPISFMS
jgi:hypothetical protein